MCRGSIEELQAITLADRFAKPREYQHWGYFVRLIKAVELQRIMFKQQGVTEDEI